jgi:anti-sigma regulatory factor (Ser/Thr protein kinase)
MPLETMTVLWSERVTLPPLATSVATARGFVEDRLASHDAAHLVEDVRLVVSELATNATRHARTRFTVLLEGGEDVVRLTVSDDSVLRLVRAEPDSTGEGGHGLSIVERCSGEWGVTEGRRNAKSVWACFDVRQPSAERVKSRG